MKEAIEIRPFDRALDYKDASAWWSARRGWAPVPLDHLSETGFIATAGKKKLCALWLYINGTALGQVEFLVTNPSAPPKLKVKAIAELVQFSKRVSISCGIRSLWTSSDNDALIRLYARQGFEVTDRQVTHLIARLG